MRMRYPLIVGVLLAIWMAAHYAGIMYGTTNVPLHISYVGDEQAPVNGALHILEDKSPLGLRNHRNVYYGPIFSMIALPAVVGDFVYRVVHEGVRSASDYKHVILFDWGGIIRGLRLTALVAALIALWFAYRIFMSPSLAIVSNRMYALCGTSLIALNFYFFEYSHFYKHWIFLLACLLGQLYYAIRIRESNGVRTSDWVLHGIFSVVSFGINYFSALYLVAYLPLAYRMWKVGGAARRLLMWYIGAIVGAGALVVAWHPYALIRYFGFVGTGSMAGKLNNIQNPFVLSGASVIYYLKVVVLNHLALVGAGAVLTVVFVRHKVRGQGWWFYMLGSIMVATAILFVPAEHHEGRYMLPVILMLLVGIGSALIHYLNTPTMRSRAYTVVLATLLGAYLVFHVVHIGKWIVVYQAGPPEQAMIARALELERDQRPILLVQNYIAGYPHTRDAYRIYAHQTGKGEVNLYQELIQAPRPSIQLLNARYVFIRDFDANPHVLDQYAHAIRVYEPRQGELNQFDYMDEDLLRLWYYDELMPRYEELK